MGCEKFKAGPIFEVEISILKKKTCRLGTSPASSHFKEILDLEMGWFSFMEKLWKTLWKRPLANWSSSNPADHQLGCCYLTQLESSDADKHQGWE